MMHETRTLKGLFADPKPTRRKNFIKENVRSLKRIEQLLHANNHDTKTLRVKAIRGNTHDPMSKELPKLQDNLNELTIGKNRNNYLPGVGRNKLAQNETLKKKSVPSLTAKGIVTKKASQTLSNNQNNKKNVSDFKNGVPTNTKLKAKSINNTTDESKSDNPMDNEHLSKNKSQGVQTLETKDLDTLYEEGIIRYPSGKSAAPSNLKHAGNPKDKKKADKIYIKPPEKKDNPQSTNTELEEGLFNSQDVTDFIKINKQKLSVASKLAAQLDSNGPISQRRAGVIPKYLKERKEALEKEKLAKLESFKSDCPKGTIAIPDHERIETLNMVKKNYKELVRELNTLPIRTDTLKSQRRKMEIEKQLNKMEEVIKVFSRPKVFVDTDS